MRRIIGLAVATNTRSPSITGINPTTVAVIPDRFADAITSLMIGIPTPTPTIDATATPTISPERFDP